MLAEKLYFVVTLSFLVIGLFSILPFFIRLFSVRLIVLAFVSIFIILAFSFILFFYIPPHFPHTFSAGSSNMP